MNPVNIHEAKTQLSRLIEAAERGEDVVIARAGKPVARLVRIEPTPPRRQPGALRGKVVVADDFDSPMSPELQQLFEGSAGEDPA